MEITQNGILKYLENTQNLNADFDSNSSGNQQKSEDTGPPAATNRQIAKLQAEMNEIKPLLTTLTQQVIPRPEEGNASRASSSRTQERVELVIGANRTRQTAPMTRNFQNDTDDDFEELMRSPAGSVETDHLLTAIHDLPTQIHSTSTNTRLLQTHMPNFRGHKDMFNEFDYLLLNHCRPFANKITEEYKIIFPEASYETKP